MRLAGSKGRWAIVWVITLLLNQGPAHSQDSQRLLQLDMLLEDLNPPSASELMQGLGPVPSLAELLVPLPAGFVPLLERPLLTAGDRGLEELASRRDLEPDASNALEFAWELAELAQERLGADHRYCARARSRALELETLALLGEEDRELRKGLDGEFAAAIQAYKKGRLDEALERTIDLVCIEYGLMGSSGNLADPLGTIATFLYEKGDYPRGERAARAAVQQSIQEAGVCDRKLANALNNLASLSTIMRRLAVGRQLHAHSLAVRRELYGDQVGEFAQALLQLAGLYRLSEDHESAARVVDRAIAILEATGEMPDRLGILLNERGVLEWLSGQDEQARESLLRSIEILRSVYPEGHLVVADAIGTLADLERARGSFEQSLKLARESYELHLGLQGRSSPQLGTPMHRLANSLEVMGDLAGAEQAYREALLGMTSATEGHSDGRVLILLSLSELLWSRGDYSGAQDMSERATLEQRGKLGRSRLFAGVLRRQSARKFLAGDLDGAQRDLEEALSICQDLFEPDHPRLVGLNVKRAALYLEQGELQIAGELLEQALRPKAELKGSERKIRADANQLAGRLALLQGQLERAADFAKAALAIRRELFSAAHPDLVESLFLLGEVAQARGDEATCIGAYSEALGLANALRTQIAGDERDRAVFAGRLSIGKIARTLALAYLDLDQPQAAFDAAEQGRERALLDLVKRSGTDLVALAMESGSGRSEQLESQLGECRSARQSLRHIEVKLRTTSSSSSSTFEDLEELEGELEEARKVLLVAEGQLESSLREVWPSADPMPAKAVAAELSHKEGLLHYTLDEHGIGLIVVRGGPAGGWLGTHVASTGEEAQELQGQVLRLLGMLRAGEPVDTDLRQSISDGLLPAAAWKLLAGCERVVLVPDGILNELPFECLRTPQGDWLEQGPHVVYSPSATLFARGRCNRSAGTKETPRALILGNPTFAPEEVEPAGEEQRATTGPLKDSLRSHFNGRLSALPGSQIEAQRIAQTLGDADWKVETLLGPDALSEALQAAARGASLVHLATHGFAARAERPYDSALALAMPKRTNAPGDGFLSLDDLIRNWGGRLKGCDLVVLSACDTQVGVVLGESRVALSWGFFFAGADSVLVSLWKVDDRATALLMDRFYTNYVGSFEVERRAGSVVFAPGQAMEEAAALHEAKAWLANSSPEENKRRLKELGFQEGGAQQSERGQFPRPSSGPTSRAISEAYEFRSPRYGGAFVLYGQPD